MAGYSDNPSNDMSSPPGQFGSGWSKALHDIYKTNNDIDSTIAHINAQSYLDNPQLVNQRNATRRQQFLNNHYAPSPRYHGEPYNNFNSTIGWGVTNLMGKIFGDPPSPPSVKNAHEYELEKRREALGEYYKMHGNRPGEPGY